MPEIVKDRQDMSVRAKIDADNTRAAATKALEEIGEGAKPAPFEEIRKIDPQRAKEAVPEVVKADPESWTQECSCYTLGRLIEEESCSPAISLARQAALFTSPGQEENEVAAAIRVAVEVDMRQYKAIHPGGIYTVYRDNKGVWGPARAFCGDIDIFPLFERLLTNSDVAIRRTALRALSKLCRSNFNGLGNLYPRVESIQFDDPDAECRELAEKTKRMISGGAADRSYCPNDEG